MKKMILTKKMVLMKYNSYNEDDWKINDTGLGRIVQSGFFVDYSKTIDYNTTIENRKGAW